MEVSVREGTRSTSGPSNRKCALGLPVQEFNVWVTICAIVRSYRALIVTCSSFPPAHAFTRDDDVDTGLECEVYIYILKNVLIVGCCE